MMPPTTAPVLTPPDGAAGALGVEVVEEVAVDDFAVIDGKTRLVVEATRLEVVGMGSELVYGKSIVDNF